MAVENESSTAAKRSLVSLPFLFIVIVLAVGGYFAGPWLMTQYFVLVDDKAPPIPYSPSTGDDPGMMGMPGMGGGGEGGEGGGRQGGGRGNFDPEAIFARRDADENGILEGEELSGRISERVAEIDTDGDGAVSKDEFLEGMKNFGGAAGRSRPSNADADDSPNSDDGASPPATAAPADTEPDSAEAEEKPLPDIEDGDQLGNRSIR